MASKADTSIKQNEQEQLLLKQESVTYSTNSSANMPSLNTVTSFLTVSAANSTDLLKMSDAALENSASFESSTALSASYSPMSQRRLHQAKQGWVRVK